MIAIDTNILVWGVRLQPCPNRPNLVEQCRLLVQDHKDRKVTIMVPSVVLAEYLTGQSDEAQKESCEIIGKHFFIAPFDTRAAAIAAEIFDKATFDSVREESETPRQCLKADYQIIATAIAHNATAIYADDGHFKSLANGKIIVKPVPEFQKELFSD